MLLSSGYPVLSTSAVSQDTPRPPSNPGQLNVFSEEQFKIRHLQLYRSSMAQWEQPYASEALDDAARQTVLDRIITALSYAGYVIEPVDSFPN